MGRFWRRGKKEEKPSEAADKAPEAGKVADAPNAAEQRQDEQGVAEADQAADQSNTHPDGADDAREPDQQGSRRQRTQEEIQAEEEELRQSNRFPRDEELVDEDRGSMRTRGRQQRGIAQVDAPDAPIEEHEDEGMAEEGGDSDADDGSLVDDRPPKVKFLDGLLVDPCEMLHSMGSMAPTAHPSILQCLVMKKNSENCMSAAIRPQLVSSGIAFRDLVLDPATKQVQGFLVPTCLLTVAGAVMVPYTGIQRPIAGRVVRVSLFSGHSFVGNVHNVQASPVREEGPTWTFDKTNPSRRCILRAHPKGVETLHVYFELNVILSPTTEDAKLFSRPTRWKARQVDEVTVAWGSIPFPQVGKDQQIPRRSQVLQVPLFGGSRLKPVQLAQAVGPGGGGFLRCGCGTSGKGATLNITLSRLSVAELRETSTLPATIVTSSQMVPFLSMFRRLVAYHLLAHAGALMAPHISVVLATYPRVVDDPQMLFNFFRLWKSRMDELPPKEKLDDKVQLREFARVLTTLWPLRHMHDYPNELVLWDANYSAAHSNVAEKYMQSSPYENLSLNSNNWLHKPFRVSELTYDYGDYTGPSV